MQDILNTKYRQLAGLVPPPKQTATALTAPTAPDRRAATGTQSAVKGTGGAGAGATGAGAALPTNAANAAGPGPTDAPTTSRKFEELSIALLSFMHYSTFLLI